jgi:hypothetical protein
MEVSGQLYAPAALLVDKKGSVLRVRFDAVVERKNVVRAVNRTRSSSFQPNHRDEPSRVFLTGVGG